MQAIAVLEALVQRVLALIDGSALSQRYGDEALVAGAAAALGLLWAAKRLMLGRSAGYYRCSLPGCNRWLRIRRFQGQGFRQYCGRHSYYELEHSKDWAKWDRSTDRFFVYILKLDAPPWWYVGQTRNLARRLREHRAGTTVTTAGSRQTLVWYETVGSRRKAVRREQKIKLWGRCRRGRFRKLTQQRPSPEAKAYSWSGTS